MPVFNCASDEGFESYPTLQTLRNRILTRLGFAAQVGSPPPGMTELINDFLLSAQDSLWTRYRALRTERFFTWTMVVGERFYDVLDNDEQTVAPTSTKVLDPERVTGAWVEDLNGAWSPLHSGVDPGLYTSAAFNGMPRSYEIRQCIEVFPAPDQAYKLRVKGHFGPLPFAANGDKCSINPNLLFLWALANAKNHYGQSDAADVAAQAQTALKDLVAFTHGTKRYVPGTHAAPVPPRPVLVE